MVETSRRDFLKASAAATVEATSGSIGTLLKLASEAAPALLTGAGVLTIGAVVFHADDVEASNAEEIRSDKAIDLLKYLYDNVTEVKGTYQKVDKEGGKQVWPLDAKALAKACDKFPELKAVGPRDMKVIVEKKGTKTMISLEFTRKDGQPGFVRVPSK